MRSAMLPCCPGQHHPLALVCTFCFEIKSLDTGESATCCQISYFRRERCKMTRISFVLSCCSCEVFRPSNSFARTQVSTPWVLLRRWRSDGIFMVQKSETTSIKLQRQKVHYTHKRSRPWYSASYIAVYANRINRPIYLITSNYYGFLI